ncbi:hypothetical protein ACFY2M_37980 [Streptomyces sp. NPDC001276]|uniref:hypothetical protein n=1 Tax=Streptomyces sp. NPDC001276 TaxID=3364555 RepID=UPI003686C63F
MGEHGQGQDDVTEPVRPELAAARAREMTAGLREAMDDVRRSVRPWPRSWPWVAERPGGATARVPHRRA